MKVVVALEHRFDRTPDGAVWTQTMFAYRYWLRYLEVFDQVLVVARVRHVAAVPADWQRADGAAVSFAAVPHYLGPWQYLRRARGVQRAVRHAVGPDDAVILRAPSTIGSAVESRLRHAGRPYGVEVVADPHDAFAPGAIKHPLRPVARWWFTRRLRQQCKTAAAAAYVTEHALQRRYPPAPAAFATHVSDVELPAAAIVAAPRAVNRAPRPLMLIAVGSLAQYMKGPDVLIAALASCVREGLDLRLQWIGDGKHRRELERQAQRRGLGDRVDFVGQLSAGASVRARLDEADLFVLPSRQEGLPRALIEAMGRGLPCIGSTVGGIPELLPPACLVPPNDVAALARKLREVATDPERLAAMSARNLEVATSYRDEVLRERRRAFYGRLRDTTATWIATVGGERPAGQAIADQPRDDERPTSGAVERTSIERQRGQ